VKLEDDTAAKYTIYDHFEMAHFKFENLIIWQKAMDLGEEMNNLAMIFPKHEMYNLSSQILRAADSVALNLAEGSTGQSNAENAKFTGYSIRSLAEVVTCLHKAKRRNYISNDDFELHYHACYNLMNMMIAYRNKLR